MNQTFIHTTTTVISRYLYFSVRCNTIVQMVFCTLEPFGTNKQVLFLHSLCALAPLRANKQILFLHSRMIAICPHIQYILFEVSEGILFTF